MGEAEDTGKKGKARKVVEETACLSKLSKT
jgi:hypothetical protein